MELSNELLAALVLYGLPLLFTAVLIGSLGLPLPSSLLLLAAGSLIDLGQLQWGVVIGLATAAAILGDNLGYALGRYGGRPLALQLSQRFNQERKVAEAERFMNRWGGPGVFFSRWLLTPIGPWINLAGGVTGYPWRRFLFWGAAGETMWVIAYVSLGVFVGERLELAANHLELVAWVTAVALAAAGGIALKSQAEKLSRRVLQLTK